MAAIPFRNSPQLAAAVVTVAAIAGSVAPVTTSKVPLTASLPVSIIFPSGFYGYFLRAVSNSESLGLGLNLSTTDEDTKIRVLTLFIPVVVSLIHSPGRNGQIRYHIL